MRTERATHDPAVRPSSAPAGRWVHAPALVVGLLGYYLLALGCIYLSRQPQDIATMWLPDAFATIWLLLLPRPLWRWLIPGIALVIPLANLSYGDPWRVAVSFVPANLLQVVLSAGLLARLVQPARAVVDPLHLLLALGLGGALPALAGATVAALGVPLLLGTPLAPSVGGLWVSWLVSTFFGVATLLPLGLWILARGFDFAALRRPSVLAGLAVVAAVTAIAPQGLPYPFAYVMLTLVFVALFGGFMVGAVAALLASVLLNAMFATGLFPDQRAAAPAGLLIVVPMLLAVIPVVLIGAVREGMQAQLQRVREGETLQRTMLDAAPSLLCLVDGEGRIVRMNAAGARLLGAADAGALVGRALDELVERTPDEGMGQALLKTLDGRHLPAEHHCVPARLAGGGAGAVHALRDLSPELEARRLREQGTRIAADNRAKSEFLSRMSHELRTPLNAVLGFAQLMEATLAQSTPVRQREQLRHIQQAGWHLLAMIDEVLELSRLDAGGLALRLQPTALAPVLAQARSMVQADAARRAVLIDTAQPPPQAWVSADPARLCQVLTNLLSNAVKYNREGGSVQVRVAPGDAGWTLQVCDTGVGIRAEQQAHLFEPFNRLDQAASSVQGTGIGLAIPRRLVEAMGGSIDFSSEHGVGTVFRVTLPAAQPTAAADPQGPAAAIAPAAPPARILCVEDDEASLQLLRQALALDGHEVRHAGDAHAALAMAREQVPDMMLIDIRLPGTSGLALRRALMNDDALAAVPCIAVTAQATADDRHAAAGLGFEAYIVKPLDLHVMRRAVAAALLARAAGRPRDAA